METDTMITIKSGDLRSELSEAWMNAVENGGAVVVTVNEIPEFCIFPLRASLPLAKIDLAWQFARDIYRPLFGEGERPPAGYDTDNPPQIGPDALRRNWTEERHRMRSLMCPFLYTYYHMIVGILFPIPRRGGQAFVGELHDAWYAEPEPEDAQAPA